MKNQQNGFSYTQNGNKNFWLNTLNKQTYKHTCVYRFSTINIQLSLSQYTTTTFSYMVVLVVSNRPAVTNGFDIQSKTQIINRKIYRK